MAVISPSLPILRLVTAVRERQNSLSMSFNRGFVHDLTYDSTDLMIEIRQIDLSVETLEAS